MISTSKRQLEARDCGPACLCIVANYYGRSCSVSMIRAKSYLSKQGVSLLALSNTAESMGFNTQAKKITFNQLVEEAKLPAILHWNQNHYVVLQKISKKKFIISDPAQGTIRYSYEEFKQGWLNSIQGGETKGIVLFIEPRKEFYKNNKERREKLNFKFLFKYLKPHKRNFSQVILALLLGSLIQLIAPFLTQSVVDRGIGFQDIDFVKLILIAQLVLIISKTSVDFIRNWLLLQISARLDISLISDFLIKLMKLPISFFETKMVGDLIQRIGDHSRIQSFLTGSSLYTMFSLINLIIFSIVLGIYDLKVLNVFLFGSLCYFLWIWFFLKKRRHLDFKRFAIMAENQSNLFQLITGMQEIKLNSCERQKRWSWERIQTKLFHVSIQRLELNQWQQAGAIFFNESKNILITFLSASSVIKGDISLGMMMSIQYIIGQLNAPIEQLISFIQDAQDAKMSIERIGEIHNNQDEIYENEPRKMKLPYDKSISVNDLSFHYGGPNSEMVLKKINLVIPYGKTTAIVGTSGSGKTTLLKLLLGFYPPIKGDITIGGESLKKYDGNFWRSQCGVVMQDGFIFSDTITGNIAPGDEIINTKKLQMAIEIANLSRFIDCLPLGLNTKIGQEGNGISQGQRQRLLIARAIYKSPEYIFFDEAPNSLDANNENEIMKNLENYFKLGDPKTVVVVAHRLSTVKNADQIIVLEKGKIIQIGSHDELSQKKGAYYQLVKNQLEF